MKIKEITSYLESLAPRSSQESYDNSGLIVGNPNDDVTSALISLDCIESTIDEAIANNCQMVIAHHPIVFKGLKKLNGTDYVQRTVLKAIKNDIAIYAIHTNLDNYRFGVNHKIGEKIGLENLQVLSPKSSVLQKLTVFVPSDHAESVRKAMFSAGAGRIGDYDQASFNVSGNGTYRPLEGSNAYEGTVGEQSQVDEIRIECVVSNHLSSSVVRAMISAHPYEEVAYDLVQLQNVNRYEGSGMVGDLASPINAIDFLNHIKSTFDCGVVRHTKLIEKPIERVAFCGGSGSFLLRNAKAAGADVYVTADFKYHEFFDAEDDIIIADIGHYESEQFTSDLLKEILTKKFPTFAVRLTEVNTNPINYL